MYFYRKNDQVKGRLLGRGGECNLGKRHLIPVVNSREAFLKERGSLGWLLMKICLHGTWLPHIQEIYLKLACAMWEGGWRFALPQPYFNMYKITGSAEPFGSTQVPNLNCGLGSANMHKQGLLVFSGYCKNDSIDKLTTISLVLVYVYVKTISIACGFSGPFEWQTLRI